MVPNKPGFYYRRKRNGRSEIVWVELWDGELFFYWAGSNNAIDVEDDGMWAGPVPEEGTWAPRPIFDDLWYEVSRLSPDKGTSAYDAAVGAKEWDAANPQPPTQA